MSKISLCRICGRKPATTKEHLPSQGAGNTGTTDVLFIDGNLNEVIRRVQEIFEKGFYREVLCGDCNSKYGSFYNTAYTDFVNQIQSATGIKDPENRTLISLENVYPVRILKQIFLMYLCIQPRDVLPGWESIRNFVRRKDTKLPSDAPKTYLYKNVSNNGRILPWMGLSEVYRRSQPIFISEISYPPVGIVFCDQEDDRFVSMESISEWGAYGFKDRCNLVVRLPELQVSTDHPLGFGTESEVARWIEECGVARLIPRPEDSESKTSVGLSLRPRPKNNKRKSG